MRVLGERDGHRALGRGALQLLHRELRVPVGQQDHGEEPTRSRSRPFVDLEVVVRPDARERQLAILEQVELGATEAGKAREAQRRDHAVDVHVLHPFDRVVTARADVVPVEQAGRPRFERPTRGCAETVHREPLAVEFPEAHPRPCRTPAGLARGARRAAATPTSDAGSIRWSSTETMYGSSLKTFGTFQLLPSLNRLSRHSALGGCRGPAAILEQGRLHHRRRDRDGTELRRGPVRRGRAGRDRRHRHGDRDAHGRRDRRVRSCGCLRRRRPLVGRAAPSARRWNSAVASTSSSTTRLAT